MGDQDQRSANVFIIVGAGVQGLTTAYRMLEEADRTGMAVEIDILASRFERETTSQSGGYVLPFLSEDHRIPRWTGITANFWLRMKEREPALARYIAEQPSLLVSRDSEPIVPPGHMGDALAVDPAEFGLTFYASARWLTEGLVVSTCMMLEALSARVFSDPRVARVPTREMYLVEIAEHARRRGATAVVLATGLGSRALLGDSEVEGVEGILLFGQLPEDPLSLHARMTVMDEDDPAELTYSIPHWGCSFHQLVVGGIAVHREPPTAMSDGSGSRNLSPEQLADADEILLRARHRFPALATWKPTLAWAGWRPSRSSVRVEALPASMTFGIPMVTAYGAGGSGWTICAGVAEDVLAVLAAISVAST